MTERDQKTVVDNVGTRVGEVIFALAGVVTALRKQPGFDSAGFDALLKNEMAIAGVGETTKLVYGLILGELPKL